MRYPNFLALLFALFWSFCLAQELSQPINVTQVEDVDQATRIGQLAYGASNLDFGYSAGAGINFGNGENNEEKRMVRVATRTLVTSEAGTVGGGFNAGIPGKSDGSLGGGWTVTANGLEFGLGAVFNNISVNVAISADKITGALSVQVNGKEVAI
tara:strand:- start:202 stop:666 length:465 start_codon:yes stop_codon:yes gene_type:complete